MGLLVHTQGSVQALGCLCLAGGWGHCLFRAQDIGSDPGQAQPSRCGLEPGTIAV